MISLVLSPYQSRLSIILIDNVIAFIIPHLRPRDVGRFDEVVRGSSEFKQGKAVGWIDYLSVMICDNDMWQGPESKGMLQFMSKNKIPLTKIDYCNNTTIANDMFTNTHFEKMTSFSCQMNGNITDVDVGDLALAASNLLDINLSSTSALTDPGIVALCNSCRKLQNVDISGSEYPYIEVTKFTDTSMLWLSIRCTGLLTLKVNGCVHLTDQSLDHLSKHCRQLQLLSAINCPELTAVGLVELSKHMTDLIEVSLGCNDNVTGAVVMAFLNNCTRLKSITFLDCLGITTVDLGESDSPMAPSLQSINLSYCRNMTDTCLSVMLKKCSGLTNINLRCTSSITDVAILSLFSRDRPAMKEFRIGYNHNVTGVAVEAMVRRCPNLEVLDVSECISIRDLAVPVTHHPSDLRKVDFNGCVNMTDHCLVGLLSNCYSLEEIYLNACRTITDESAKTLSSKWKLLKYMSLNRCDNIANMFLIELLKNCPLLKEIDVSYCPKITGDGLYKLSKIHKCNHEKLLYIIFSQSNLTSFGLIALSKICPRLDRIVLTNCAQITEETVICLSTNCRFLKKIYLSGPTLTDESLTSLVENCPNLELIDGDRCDGLSDDILAVLKETHEKINFILRS